METLFTLLAVCEGKYTTHRDPPYKWPVMRIFDVYMLLAEQTIKKTVQLSVIWNATAIIWLHCNE